MGAYDRYLEHIDTEITSDTPVAFGLHTNAEIDFRTTQSNVMFNILMELAQASGSGGGDDEDGGGAALTPQEVAAEARQTILDGFGEKLFDVEDVQRSLDEQGPYQNVFLQEMDLINRLLTEMARSLKELGLGFAGELTMTDQMETLMTCLYMDRQPPLWSKFAWPSKRPLSMWLFSCDQGSTQRGSALEQRPRPSASHPDRHWHLPACRPGKLKVRSEVNARWELLGGLLRRTEAV